MFNSEVLIDILCLDCSFLNVRVNLIYLIIESVYLKAESSIKNRIRIPGGQVKPNLICLIGKKESPTLNCILCKYHLILLNKEARPYAYGQTI